MRIFYEYCYLFDFIFIFIYYVFQFICVEIPKKEVFYTVRYDDGDVEENISRLRIRVEGEKQSKSLAVGEVVDACCKACKDDVLRGVISGRGPRDDEYRVTFDIESLGLAKTTGKTSLEEIVQRKHIFARHGPSPDEHQSSNTNKQRDDGPLSVGLLVEARYGVRPHWFAGKITKTSQPEVEAEEDGDVSAVDISSYKPIERTRRGERMQIITWSIN